MILYKNEDLEHKKREKKVRSITPIKKMKVSVTSPERKGEKWLEAELTKRVKRLGGHALKFSSVTEVGYPDRIVMMPGGKIYWCEIKSEGKDLRPIQKIRKAELESLGQNVFVINSESVLNEFIDKIKVLEG